MLVPRRPHHPGFIIEPPPPTAPPPPPSLDERRAWRIAAVDAACAAAITARHSVPAQLNLAARAIELIEAGETHTPEANRLRAVRGWITAMRARAAALRALVAQAEDPATVAIEGWPLHPDDQP